VIVNEQNIRSDLGGRERERENERYIVEENFIDITGEVRIDNI